MSQPSQTKIVSNIGDVPQGNLKGFVRYFREDVIAGFLVFLIALPLCLGIALASGFPPMAGIFTAIIGAIVTSMISNSELTIKGPAAGLIVIALECVNEFGGDGFTGGFSSADLAAYRAALAVGAAAAVFQIVFALIRAGVLGEFFPLSVVHGMLAAIGVIIISKQLPVVMGVTESYSPLELLTDFDELFEDANPAIALIGLSSLLIMFLWPYAKNLAQGLRLIPAPVIVALVAVPMGMMFDLTHPHSYFLSGHEYELGEKYLVSMPDQVFGMLKEVTYPDFSALGELKAWKWVFLFFVIGTLESVLSAKAIDMIDPWKRKTNIDRDILAVGAANLCSAMVGGLPMISEIVRSKANIDNGARTRFADMWHGIFLLICVALIPMVLHLLPLAALAAMLVYTGFRLAHPKEFLHVYQIGREQLVIFVTTLVGVLATDLLIGVAIGIAVKLTIHVANGVPLKSLFVADLDVEPSGENSCLIRPHSAAVFSNWLSVRKNLEKFGLDAGKNILLDLSDVRLVDHSVMDKLRGMQADFEHRGLRLELLGLESHVPLSRHESSARKRGLRRMRRVTIYADAELEETIVEQFVRAGAIGYSSVPCHRTTQRWMVCQSSRMPVNEQVRLEFLVAMEAYIDVLQSVRKELPAAAGVNICVETVEVMQGARQIDHLVDTRNGSSFNESIEQPTAI